MKPSKHLNGNRFPSSADGHTAAMNPALMQMCSLVPDLEAAIDGWCARPGWGRSSGSTRWRHRGRHRGKPADFPTSTAAIAYAGDIQIEPGARRTTTRACSATSSPGGQYGPHLSR